MSLSTWPGSNLTSSSGYQLAGTALVATASLVPPSSIPGYGYVRTLKAKLVAGIAIAAVIGVILLSPTVDTNASVHDVGLEHSVEAKEFLATSSDSWHGGEWEVPLQGDYGKGDLFRNPSVETRCPVSSGQEFANCLGLGRLHSILHSDVSTPLHRLDTFFHKVSDDEDDTTNALFWPLLRQLDLVFHALAAKVTVCWTFYDVVSLVLFLRLCLQTVRWLFKMALRGLIQDSGQPEITFISDVVWAAPGPDTERFVPEFDATLQLLATISFVRRDGRPHSTGYLFDMHPAVGPTRRLFAQAPAPVESRSKHLFRTYLSAVHGGYAALLSIVWLFQKLLSLFRLPGSRREAGSEETQSQAAELALDQTILPEDDIYGYTEESPIFLGLHDGENPNALSTSDSPIIYGPYDCEGPASPAREAYHSIPAVVAEEGPVALCSAPSEPLTDSSKGKAKEVSPGEGPEPPTGREQASSSTEKLLRGAAVAVDEVLCGASPDSDKVHDELYKSMRIIKDLLAALMGQVEALDIPEDDYSGYLSEAEVQPNLHNGDDNSLLLDQALTLITDTQSGCTYECTSRSDEDSLTLSFIARDNDNSTLSSLPSGELALIRKKDSARSDGGGSSCTTVIATGPIFSPPYIQPTDPDAPIFVVIPGHRRYRYRGKRSKGKKGPKLEVGSNEASEGGDEGASGSV